MKLITRAQMGWPPSAAPDQATANGTKVHYEGSPVTRVSHDKCVGRWTAIRNAHLNHPTENYSDVAYNFAVCQHGYVLEGRGVGKRTGANGNQTLNSLHYAVVVLIGSSGDTQPTAEAVAALREVIAYLRKHGAGKEIKGHRDGYATACPGQPLYNLVTSGKLEPTSLPPEETDDVTPADITAIAAAVAKLLLRTDGQYVAPTSAADYSADPADSTHWWSGQTLYQDLINKVREIDQKVSVLDKTGLTEVQMNRIAELVAEELSARLAD